MAKRSKSKTVKPGLYAHYKGKNYEVIGVAHHSESGEALVVYKALYRTKYGNDSLWVRPLAMFTADIEVEGKRVARFRYLGRRP
jgi:hypothetical protein